MIDIIYAQTVLVKEDLEKLKRKAGVQETQKALRRAIQHYLECKF